MTFSFFSKSVRACATHRPRCASYLSSYREISGGNGFAALVFLSFEIIPRALYLQSIPSACIVFPFFLVFLTTFDRVRRENKWTILDIPCNIGSNRNIVSAFAKKKRKKWSDCDASMKKKCGGYSKKEYPTGSRATNLATLRRDAYDNDRCVLEECDTKKRFPQELGIICGNRNREIRSRCLTNSRC